MDLDMDMNFEETDLNNNNNNMNGEESFLGNNSLNPDKFKIDYPYFKGMPNEEVQSIMNETILSEINSLISKAVLIPGDENLEEVVIAYQVPLNEQGLVSIVFSIYTYAGGANGITMFSSLTMDTNTGETFEFDDLFKADSDYRKTLSDLAVKKAEENDVQFINEYTGVTDNQQFYLTPNGIVLYYQPIEFTPHYYGLFRIMIPYSEIEGVLNPESPVNNFINNTADMD